MGALLQMARAAGDAALWPFFQLPPLWGLVLLSGVCGVVLLLAFRLVTPQARLAVVKDRMSATIYEMRLYSASPGRVLRAQGRAVGLTGVYLGLAVPSFVLLVPVVGLLLVRASLLYEVRPLDLHETARVSLTLDSPVPRSQLQARALTPGIEVVPPLLVLDGGRSVHLRVRARQAGTHRLALQVGSQRVVKEVQVRGPSSGDGAVSPDLARPGDWALLLSREPALPVGSALAGVELAYPARDEPWPGLPWYVHLLVISMVAALALRRRLGVVF